LNAQARELEQIIAGNVAGDSEHMSKSWKTTRLGSMCRVIPGYAFKSSDWQAEGIPVVKIKNITTDSAVDLTETDCVPDQSLRRSSKSSF